MMRLSSFAVILAALSGKVSAATIGPTANLQIVNQIISPDGFQRSYATCRWCDLIRTLTSALYQCLPRWWYFPRPRDYWEQGQYSSKAFPFPFLESRFYQGADFSLNVINNLRDNTMDLVTSIVRVSLIFRYSTIATFSLDSTGTVCSKRPPIMLTVLPLSLNVLLCLGGVSPTDSAERTKLYCVPSSDTSLQLILSDY